MRKSDALGLFEKALGSQPVMVREFGLTMNYGASEKEITTSIRNLLNSEQSVTVRARFMMGDLYNQIHKQKGLRKWLSEMVEAEFGLKTYQMLRTYGWVANKWPEQARTDAKGWTHYLRNKPGGEAKEEEDRETPLLLARVERGEGISMFHLETKTGRKFVYQMADDWTGAEDARTGARLLTGTLAGADMLHEEREPYAYSRKM